MTVPLAVCGIPLLVAEGSWRETRMLVGSRGRSGDGSFRAAGTGHASAWNFETTWMTRAQASGWAALLSEDGGHAWDFESISYPLFSSGGLLIGNATAGSCAASSGGRTGLYGLTLTSTTTTNFRSCTRSGVSLGFSARMQYPSGSALAWHYWWASLGVDGTLSVWVDGVAVPTATFTALLFSLTFSSFTLPASSAVTGGLFVDDVLLLFSESDAVFASGFSTYAATTAVPFLPRVGISGELPGALTNPVLVHGVVGDVATATMALDDVGLVVARRLSVMLEQADVEL